MPVCPSGTSAARGVSERSDASAESREKPRTRSNSPSARTSQQPQGKTLLKRRQLQAAGWRLMGVPYWEWDACRRDRAEQCALLSARLDEAVPGWQSGCEY